MILMGEPTSGVCKKGVRPWQCHNGCQPGKKQMRTYITARTQPLITSSIVCKDLSTDMFDDSFVIK